MHQILTANSNTNFAQLDEEMDETSYAELRTTQAELDYALQLSLLHRHHAVDYHIDSHAHTEGDDSVMATAEANAAGEEMLRKLLLEYQSQTSSHSRSHESEGELRSTD